MPSVSENKATWESYDWSQQGDEWSTPWGGASTHWYYGIRPRIKNHLPCDTILEIAPGYGRWTQFLKDQCGSLTIVDIADNCIKACKKRFATAKHITYHVNDGYSLSMIEPNSIDFVFSFDSLVHVEMDVLDSYLAQLATKMKPDGTAFIHHSNMGQYPLDTPNSGVRGRSVTGGLVALACLKYGLRCQAQEFVYTGENDGVYTDCYSTFVRQGPSARENRIAFTDGPAEAKHVTEMLRLYG